MEHHSSRPRPVAYRGVQETGAGPNFGGQIFDLEDYRVRLSDFSFYGSGDKFVAGVRAWPVNYASEPLFSPKRFGGKVWLFGDLVLSPESNSVYLRKADFSIQTRNVLLIAANWLLHAPVKHRLEHMAHFTLPDKDASQMQALENYAWVTKQGVEIRVHSSVTKAVVYPTEADARIRVTLEGVARILGPEAQPQ